MQLNGFEKHISSDVGGGEAVSAMGGTISVGVDDVQGKQYDFKDILKLQMLSALSKCKQEIVESSWKNFAESTKQNGKLSKEKSEKVDLAQKKEFVEKRERSRKFPVERTDTARIDPGEQPGAVHETVRLTSGDNAVKKVISKTESKPKRVE